MFSYLKIKDTKLEQVFDIDCKYSIIQSKYNEEVEKVSKSANIQGFRKGHVPTKFIEDKYGKSIVFDSFEKILQSVISHIIKENNYRLSSQPDVDFDDKILLDGGKDFKAKITFSIFPEIPELNLENIVLHTYKINANENDVSDALELFKKQNSTNQTVQREIKTGDVVKLTCHGYLNDVEFKEGHVKDYMLEIGSKSFIDTFEDQLVGKKAGDKCDVFVTFPENYHAKHLSGKPVKFTVEISEVFEKKPVEITEELLKSKTKSTNLEEFKKELKETIEKQYDNFIRDSVKKDVFDMIAKSLDFEVPSKVLQNLIDTTVKHDLQANDRLSDTQKQSETEIIEKAGVEAKIRIMLSLYIQDFSYKNNITSNEEDIFSFLMDEASRTGMNPFELMNLYSENDKSGNTIKEIVKEQKTYKTIFDKITKNYKNVTKSEFEEMLKNPAFKLVI